MVRPRDLSAARAPLVLAIGGEQIEVLPHVERAIRLLGFLDLSAAGWLAEEIVAGPGEGARQIRERGDKLSKAERLDLGITRGDGHLSRQAWGALNETGRNDPVASFDMTVDFARKTIGSAARWWQMQRTKAMRPYVRYTTAGDQNVHPTHGRWHDVVLPLEHDFWLSHWPPNGRGCRCLVQSVSERDLARYGWRLTDDDAPVLALFPPPGFHFHPAL